MRENQLLRERVDALEFQKLDEDQRFATPNGSDGQLERPPKKETDSTFVPAQLKLMTT